MKDYYHYFVNKGNHLNKNNILKQEEYRFKTFKQNITVKLFNKSQRLLKRMINLLHQELFIKNKIIVEYSEQENTSRLKRKEKVCHEIKHSS